MKQNLKLIVNNEVECMAPEIVIVPAQAHHIRELSQNLRENDRKEILSLGLTVERALWVSYKRALYKWAALIDGEVAAVWGINGTFMGQKGTPWLMTTPVVNKISPLKFARIYQQEVRKMLNLFPILENYVDSSYNEAIRLLEIIGFQLDEAAVLGKNVALFRKFRIEEMVWE